MAIQVKVKKLSAWHHDLPDQIKVAMLNEVADDFAREVIKALGKTTCKKHPRSISTITIIPDRNQNMIVEKNFCCPEFEASMAVKIER